MITGQEVKLCYKFNKFNAKFCNFNLNGDLILVCTVKSNVTSKDMNLVCVFSIGPTHKVTKIRETKCRSIHMIPEEAELIDITKYNKIWLRLNHSLYEFDLLTGNSTMASSNIYEVTILNDWSGFVKPEKKKANVD